MGCNSGAAISSRHPSFNPTHTLSEDTKVLTTDLVTFALANVRNFDADHAIYVDAANPNNCILAGEVEAKLKSIVALLKVRGLLAGDCVCIHSYNSIWYPLLWLAVIAAGGIVTGSNPANTSTELAHHFKSTQTKFVVAQKESLAAVKEAVSKCDIPPSNILILGANRDLEEHTKTRGTAFQKQRPGWHVIEDEEKKDDAVAVYAATSGTTGLPKAAELSHKYIVAQSTMIEHLLTGHKEQIACLPVFHAFAAQLSIILPLRLGITTYFMPRFHELDYLKYVRQFQITHSAVVPPIVTSLLHAAHTQLHSLRYIICAGAPLTALVQNQLYEKLDSTATITQCWGTTEVGWITAFSQSERDHSGSVGRALPGTIVKIFDQDGSLVTSPNTIGEARVMSNSMLKRYRNNKTATASAFDGQGFYRTGDLAYFDETDRIFIVGRVKDTFKVNGWQVSPEEIEHTILELDQDIVDCAVVGHTTVDSVGLEETKPRAFLVRKPGSAITATDIHQHVNERLVRYKRLTGGVIFVKKIPRSNTGKILRRKLAEAELEQGCNMYEEENSQEKEAEKEKGKGVSVMNHYALAALLVPLCVALGLPGLVLLCVGFRLMTHTRT